MKGILRDHYKTLNSEVYDLKFKDKVDRNAFRIQAKEGKHFDKIEIIKVPKETNRLLIKLYEEEQS